MTPETVESKARRYLAEGRLTVTHVLGDQLAAVCMSESGPYDLGHTPGRGWFCSCPVRADRCSHLTALMLVAIRKRSA
jgi:hypothetical protein